MLLAIAAAFAAPRFVAHRGVHQTFSPDGVDATTCTAARIDPPTHPYLENTIASMRAAFDAGADRVELDLHLTADGQLAVIHDADLACRTDGSGPPESHTLAELQALDLAFGYTADGTTFPLRGTGIGALPSLPEVLAAFPGRAFVLDVKAGGAEVGDAIAEALATVPDRSRFWAYGSTEAVDALDARVPEVRTFGAHRVKTCLIRDLLTGWTGRAPRVCADTVVLLPIDWRHRVWGGAVGLQRRMARVGTEVVLMGPYVGVTTGIDDLETLGQVPVDFDGWVWTNRIEVVESDR